MSQLGNLLNSHNSSGHASSSSSLYILYMEGEKKNFDLLLPQVVVVAPRGSRKGSERDRLLYSCYFASLVSDIQWEVEGILGNEAHFQTVLGLVQQRVPKVGTDYQTLTSLKCQLSLDHPLVHFVATMPRPKRSMLAYCLLCHHKIPTKRNFSEPLGNAEVISNRFITLIVMYFVSSVPFFQLIADATSDEELDSSVVSR